MSRRGATLLLFTAGYFIAVVLAVVVTVVLIFRTPLFPDQTGYATPFEFLRDLPMLLGVGLIWTFPCALPGFIVAVALGEKMRWQGWFPYAAAGFVNAAPALALFSVFIDSLSDMDPMVISSFPGGFVGGAAYWFAAGQRVAHRRAERTLA